MVNPLTPGVHYKVILSLNVYVYTCFGLVCMTFLRTSGVKELKKLF